MHVLYKLFLEDLLNEIDEKYKSVLSFNDEKLYLYSNVFQSLIYYNQHTYRKNPDYGLYDKVINLKRDEITQFLIQEIKENSYDSNLIILLYSYVANYVLTNAIDNYITKNIVNYDKLTKKKKMYSYSKLLNKITAQYYKERFYKKITTFEINLSELNISDLSKTSLDQIFAKYYLFSYGKEVLSISLNNFKLFHKKNNSSFKALHKMASGIFDLFTRSKKISAKSLYTSNPILKIDYLNKENKLWKDAECYLSFSDVYFEALSKAKEIITLLSEQIHYNTKNHLKLSILLK